MRAIIHCGGKGTRLPTISKFIPKPMVEINGKPLLYWNIKSLKKHGVTEICITLHYLPEKIVDYFGDGKKFGVTITYSYESKLLGTGGALIPVSKFITTDTVVLYGDLVCRVDYKKMLSYHKKKRAIVTAAIHPSAHPNDSDLVTYDKNYKLIKINKKPHNAIPQDPHNLAALYIVSPKVVEHLLLKTPFDIAQDLLPNMLQSNARVFCYNTSEFIMDIGTPERLKKAYELLKR